MALIDFWLCFACVDFGAIFVSKNVVLSKLTPIFPGKVCRNFSNEKVYKTTGFVSALVYSSNFQLMRSNVTKYYQTKDLFFYQACYQESQNI